MEGSDMPVAKGRSYSLFRAWKMTALFKFAGITGRSRRVVMIVIDSLH